MPFWHVTIIQLDTPLAAAIPNNQRNKILILLRWVGETTAPSGWTDVEEVYPKVSILEVPPCANIPIVLPLCGSF